MEGNCGVFEHVRSCAIGCNPVTSSSLPAALQDTGACRCCRAACSRRACMGCCVGQLCTATASQ